jgi:putative transposase
MFYYESVRDDSEVETKLNSYVENKLLCNRGCPEYYKRLRREGIGWNHKRVERVYRKMGLSRRRKKKRRIPNPEKRPLVRPDLKNEIWSMDFVEDRLENGRKIRTLNIIDDYNREAIAMEVSFSFPAERVIEVLRQCIEWRGKPKRIRSDNGTEFIANKTKTFFSNTEIEHIPLTVKFKIREIICQFFHFHCKRYRSTYSQLYPFNLIIFRIKACSPLRLKSALECTGYGTIF